MAQGKPHFIFQPGFDILPEGRGFQPRVAERAAHRPLRLLLPKPENNQPQDKAKAQEIAQKVASAQSGLRETVVVAHT